MCVESEDDVETVVCCTAFVVGISWNWPN